MKRVVGATDMGAELPLPELAESGLPALRNRIAEADTRDCVVAKELGTILPL